MYSSSISFSSSSNSTGTNRDANIMYPSVCTLPIIYCGQTNSFFFSWYIRRFYISVLKILNQLEIQHEYHLNKLILKRVKQIPSSSLGTSADSTYPYWKSSTSWKYSTRKRRNGVDTIGFGPTSSSTEMTMATTNLGAKAQWRWNWTFFGWNFRKTITKHQWQWCNKTCKRYSWKPHNGGKIMSRP